MMNIDGIVRIITLILAPVVMVSCCVLFLNGQLQRYDALGSRMRALIQERFAILREVDNDASSALKSIDGFRQMRVHEIETQMPLLMRRHIMLHYAALIIGLAIMICIISMFIIAIAVLLKLVIIAIIALCTFLAGTATLLLGGVIIMLELYLSHLSVRYEVTHALSLGTKTFPLTDPFQWKRATHGSHAV